jgi:hypothetical protein
VYYQCQRASSKNKGTYIRLSCLKALRSPFKMNTSGCITMTQHTIKQDNLTQCNFVTNLVNISSSSPRGCGLERHDGGSILAQSIQNNSEDRHSPIHMVPGTSFRGNKAKSLTGNSSLSHDQTAELYSGDRWHIVNEKLQEMLTKTFMKKVARKQENKTNFRVEIPTQDLLNRKQEQHSISV